AKMLQVVKVRLYPNEAQKQLLSQHFGSCRFIYNRMLSMKIKDYSDGIRTTAYDLKKLLPVMKKSEEFSWLKDIDSTALQNSILNMDKAYQNFFRRVKNGEKSGLPQFKSRHNSRQSYQSSTSTTKDGNLYLPKIGEIKAKFHRGDIVGKIKTVTVSCESNQYFASINYEDGSEQIYGTNNGKPIGVDVGVKVFAYTSENIAIKHINLKKEIANVIKAQKVLSRRKKGSANRVKAKAKLAKKHLKLKNKRNDFLHKITKTLSENQTVAVENLKIKNMSKQAKGSIENPNMRASAKRGLNRSILQQSWGKFFELLEYKLERNGGKLVRVDPKFTSQKCSCCGHIEKENRLKQAQFICKNCGNTLNADYNASINILNAVGTTVKAS
ncbi:MAG: transposase, partial [Epsilonproteobacteria bacterium]|nr:transposase [Campylobacterota bacterium]